MNRKREKSSPLVLRLYIAGDAPNSVRALANLRSLKEQFPHISIESEVIDTLEEPLRALNDGVRVTPTLLKLSPPPAVEVIGNLSRRAEVLDSLGLIDGAKTGCET